MLLSQIRIEAGIAAVARDGTEAAIVEAAPFGLPLINPLAQGPRPGHGARHLTLKDMT